MNVIDFFKNFSAKVKGTAKYFREFGSYKATFSAFGDDMYQSDIVRSCIRSLAEHTSKAQPKSSNARIERMLNYYPNQFMTGKDFLYKIRTMYELKNTAFILIMRDSDATITGFYPIPHQMFEVLQDETGSIFIKFYFKGGQQSTFAFEDLVILRKDYNNSDIAGDDNGAILDTLELISTTYQGIGNAIKSTANIRGILKSTKAMMNEADLKRIKDTFVADYTNLENESGIATLDATLEYTPLDVKPMVANWTHMKEFRENIYRYFGINDNVIMSSCTEDQFNSFYEARIEPFLLALSQELTRKCFTSKELGFNNFIMFASNRLAYASMATKISLLKEAVLNGAMLVNEWREIMNWGPIAGGDIPIRRLDVDTVNDPTMQEQSQEEPKKEEQTEVETDE